MKYITKNIDAKLVPYLQVFQKSNGYAFEIIITADFVLNLCLLKLESSFNKEICVKQISYPSFNLKNGLLMPSFCTFPYTQRLNVPFLLKFCKPFTFDMKSFSKEFHYSLVTIDSTFNVIKIIPYLFLKNDLYFIRTELMAQDLIINYMIWMKRIKKHSEALINSGKFI